MRVRIYISRDWRTGGALDFARDRYRYECADIPVDVTVRKVQDDYDIENARIAEDVCGMREIEEHGRRHTVCTDELLFREGQPITLHDAEEILAMEEYARECGED